MVRHATLTDAIAAAKRLGSKYGTSAAVYAAGPANEIFPFGVYLANSAVEAYWAK